MYIYDVAYDMHNRICIGSFLKKYINNFSRKTSVFRWGSGGCIYKNKSLLFSVK